MFQHPKPNGFDPQTIREFGPHNRPDEHYPFFSLWWLALGIPAVSFGVPIAGALIIQRLLNG